MKVSANSSGDCRGGKGDNFEAKIPKLFCNIFNFITSQAMNIFAKN